MIPGPTRTFAPGARRAACWPWCGAVLLGLFWVVACGRGTPRRPNVILIVADTLRTDRLGAYGSRARLTPFLDDLARRGTVFANAYAASSWTCPSVASLFTSRYPSQHHVTSFDARLSAGEVTLAERLRDAGYETLGLSANLRLMRQLGYGQGFHAWGSALVRHAEKVPTDRLAGKALGWLARVRQGWRPPPLFLYLQLMEPHPPYGRWDPAARRRTDSTPEQVTDLNAKLIGFRWNDLSPADRRRLESLYDAEIAEMDERLRRFFDLLAARGVLDDAIVVFAADHGEEFADHGMFMHGNSLFNELIHVPLVVLAPGLAGARVAARNVSLLDVAPTILDLLGLAPESRFEGRSLVPLLRDDAPDVEVRAELSYGATAELARHALAVMNGPLKLLIAQPFGVVREQPLLFDLARDPVEMHPNPSYLADRVLPLYKRARRVQRAIRERGRAEPERVEVDPRIRERLRALGYAN